MKASQKAVLFAAVAAASSSVVSSVAFGVDRTWDGFFTNSFTQDTNWTLNVAPGAADAARFRNQSGINRSLVILDANRTVAEMTIDGVPGVGAYVFQQTGNSLLTVTNDIDIGFGGLGATPVTFNGFRVSSSALFLDNGTLNLTGGAQVTTAGQFGVQSVGVLNLSGSSANPGNLDVFDTGVVNVNSGGSVTAASRLQLTDAGSRININSGGALTYNGFTALFSGTLTLNAGGTLNIGANELDTDGAARINFNRDFVLPAGKTINIKQGGTLASTQYLDVGTSGAGTFIVTGTGSAVEVGSAGALRTDWGNSGGTANIIISDTAGARYTRGLNIGALGGSAIVNLNTGALLQVDNFIAAGGNGTASITINNARLESFGTSVFGNNATVALQSGELRLAANATFLPGSTLNRTGGSFTVESGTTLAVAGGTINNTAFEQRDGVTVIVTNNGGVGGKFDNTGIYDIANDVASGTLLVDGAGSRVTAAGAGAAWGVSGGAATVTFSNSGAGTINNLLLGSNTGTARLNLLSGGQLNVTGGLTTGGSAPSTASITINGGTLRTLGAASFLNGTNISLSGGTLSLGGNTTLSNGAQLSFAGGTLTNSAGVALNVTGGALSKAVPATFSNGLKLNLSAGFVNFGGGATFSNGAAFNWTGDGWGLDANATLAFDGGAGSFTAGQAGLFGGAALRVLNGGTLVTTDKFDIANPGGPAPTTGLMLVAGPGSSFTSTALPASGNFSTWGNQPGQTATITFSGAGVGSYNAGLQIAPGGGGATVNVDSSAQLNTASLIAGRTTAGASDGVNINVSGGRLNVVGAASFHTGANVKLQAGTINFGGSSTFNTGSTFNWSGGTWNNAAGTTIAFEGGVGSFTVAAGDFIELSNNSTFLINNGTVTSSTAIDIGSHQGGQVRNGTMIVQGPNARFTSTASGPFDFANWSFRSGDNATITFANSGVGSFNAGIRAGELGGAATVNIQSSAVLNTANLFAGNPTGASNGVNINVAGGRINVVGAASFNNGAAVNVTGSGVLQLGGNATFSTGSTFNGSPTGGLSRASNTTLAFDGGAGTFQPATFVVQDGNTLRVTNGGRFTTLNDIQIGFSNAGTLLVDGPNSALVTNNPAAQASSFANGGQATATFSNGGAGTFAQELQIGAAGSANVNISSGGVIHANRIATSFAGGTATINVNGGTLRTTGNANLFANATLNYAAGTVNVGGTLGVGLNGTSAKVLLTPGGNKVLRIGGLSIPAANGGKVDLADNAMVVNYSGPSPVNTIRQLIGTGHNGGNWGGNGVTSSTAAATPGTGLGYFDDAGPGVGAIIVRYTLYGDGNLDGAVNITDFAFLAANFNVATNRWSLGDFNYDGTTGISDFALLASNFNRSLPGDLPVLSAAEGPRGGAVPEPGALGFLGTLAVALQRRCRAKK